MSLTSTELNYLVWRYLQESGFDLAAFALEKHSQCLSYEHNKNLPIISRIEPGCLVNLVQKGILFTLAEGDTRKDGSDQSTYSLLGALLQEELDKQKQEDEEVKYEQQLDANNKERFSLKSEVKAQGDNEDIEMKDGDDEVEKKNDEEVEAPEIPIEFTTKSLIPDIKYPECLTTHWHPSTDVFAYGKDNSTAVINAIKGNVIAESVTLNHPNVLKGSSSTPIENEITTVSWAPMGNIIVTAGINGELRAWSPDGKLKNIANTAASFGIEADALAGYPDTTETEHTPALISSLIWSESGQYLLSIAVNNQVCLWDGNNLNLIQIIKSPNTSTSETSTIDACWIDEFKFALSTPKNSIKVYSITTPQINGGQFNISQSGNLDSLVKPIGFLPGHNNNISILKFSTNSKLLASSSDYDYVIKIWKSSSTQESLELNTQTKNVGLKLHSSPIIGLFWLNTSENESVLLSVSMEGIVNMWSMANGDAIISANVFKNEDNFNFPSENTATSFANKKDSLIFNASVSPDNNWLAIGDDAGRISVWDIAPSRYSGRRKDVLRCMGCHDLQILKDTLDNKVDIGICDLSWDNSSLKLSVSYKGLESAIFNWK
ncbi:uncharacterized protein AC631_00932 [Debaryomyces fabryi]|uniref:LisH domain-containing protein n=1 Tax=Debaryomyces fabryi TaxID=58627 RepID=A0A0V1Q428_9ASCO|nr:uncharacterized protein AC631_00932 [Debaryomyces fabryi]KSA03294.1 hypothetical protein AC631_00932 [Debaryomyces fabryi]CUM45117.1 unnamed protein product [Debaryomyces fabryi]